MKLALLIVGLVVLALLLGGPLWWARGPAELLGGLSITVVGLVGAVFGAVVGLAGGLFGAVVGLLAGLFGAAVGLEWWWPQASLCRWRCSPCPSCSWSS